MWSVHVEFVSARPVPHVMQSICGACRSVLTRSGCVFLWDLCAWRSAYVSQQRIPCLRVFASSYPSG